MIMAKTDSRMPSRASERKASLAAVAARQAERQAAMSLSDSDLVTAVRERALKAQDNAAPESLGKCMSDDEPTGAKHGVSPIAGSVLPSDDGTATTGVCPLCGTRANLHAKRGVVLQHVMRGETLPASRALSEPRVQPTDTGTRVGDPEAGSKRRATEIDGAWQRGTVLVKIKTGRRVKTEERPATGENLRTALDQAKATLKRLTKAESITEQTALVASLRRRLTACEDGESAMDAPSGEASQGVTTRDDVTRTAGQRDEARIDGVAMTRGRDTGTLTQEQWQAGQEGKQGPRRTTLDAPLGRERVDPRVLEPTGIDELSGGRYGYLTHAEYDALSATRKRRYRAYVQTAKERAQRARAYASRLPKVQHSNKTGTLAHAELTHASDTESLGRLSEVSDTQALMRHGHVSDTQEARDFSRKG